MTEFAPRFISLGGDCQPAQQIRHNARLTKHFFDWLTVPVSSVTRLVETDFARFLRAEDLVPDQDDRRLYKVIDRFNGMEFSHDFKSFDENNIKAVQARYGYLADKFLSLYDEAEDEPPHFIRRWHPIDGPEDESSALVLHDVLIKRIPKAQLLYLHNDEERSAVVRGSYRSIYLPQKSETWEGDHAAWRFILTIFANR